MIDSEWNREKLKQAWEEILNTASKSENKLPLSHRFLSSVAMSFSFGLDENNDIADDSNIIYTFVDYLRRALDQRTLDKYIPLDLAKGSIRANGRAFGKPVWDFEYPESSFFITENGFVGCSISPAAPGDIVVLVLGSTYPLILRPESGYFLIRGYAYVHGVMRGERQDTERQSFMIR